MAENFSLSSLVPNPLTFTDDAYGGDGTTYDVQTNAMLSAADFAKMDRINADLSEIAKTTGDAPEQLKLLEQRADELMELLVPKLPEERRQAIPFMFKFKLLEWWKSKQPQLTQGGASPPAKAGRPVRGRRSPESVASTG